MLKLKIKQKVRKNINLIFHHSKKGITLKYLRQLYVLYIFQCQFKFQKN